jgi:hypothetical protein
LRVAWLTHHVERSESADWLLPGGVGGAELTDAAMIEQAPVSVSVDVIQPADWEQAFDFDRVIITGTDLLTDEAMWKLADLSPIVWVHHQQIPNRARAELFSRAKPFVTMSEAHSLVEKAWSTVASEWCHGHIDLDIEPAEKEHAALWAARNHPQKGLLAARRWARQQDIPLTELSSVSRSEVLEAMAAHEWFVFLPQAFDSCPRTLIEAEAAGCKIHTNNAAGRRDEGPLDEVMAAQAPKFWSWL